MSQSIHHNNLKNTLHMFIRVQMENSGYSCKIKEIDHREREREREKQRQRQRYRDA
jgi:hypothetical protein